MRRRSKEALTRACLWCPTMELAGQWRPTPSIYIILRRRGTQGRYLRCRFAPGMCLDWALKLLTSGSTPPPPPPLHPLRIQSSQPASVSQGPALCPETTPGFRCVTAPASFVGVGKQALSRVYPPFELTTSGSTLTGGTSIPPNPVELASVRYRCISRVIGGFHDRLST